MQFVCTDTTREVGSIAELKHLKVSSEATQVLFIFIIRTRRYPFKRRPNRWFVVFSLNLAALVFTLPFTLIAGYPGFVPLSSLFLLILLGMIN
jgi:Mg2+-importing ATPase